MFLFSLVPFIFLPPIPASLFVSSILFLSPPVISPSLSLSLSVSRSLFVSLSFSQTHILTHGGILSQLLQSVHSHQLSAFLALAKPNPVSSSLSISLCVCECVCAGPLSLEPGAVPCFFPCHIGCQLSVSISLSLSLSPAPPACALQC